MSDPLVITGTFMLGASAGALLTYARQRGATADCRKALELASTSFNKPSEATVQTGMKAFVLGRDAEVLSVFSTVLREKGIQAEKCFHESSAIEQLSSKKFELVVLDCDGSRECVDILRHLPNPNKKAVVIAVASDAENMEHARQFGAGLVVGRPLDLVKIREFLRCTYGRMLRDSQAYFRFAIELPVSIRTASGTVLTCTTLNISQNGIAIMTPSSFSAGEEVTINFEIPGTRAILRAEGNVIWDDKHGKAGIHFRCNDAAVQSRYFAWLHDQFFVARESERSGAEAEELEYVG